MKPEICTMKNIRIIIQHKSYDSVVWIIVHSAKLKWSEIWGFGKSLWSNFEELLWFLFVHQPDVATARFVKKKLSLYMQIYIIYAIFAFCLDEEPSSTSTSTLWKIMKGSSHEAKFSTKASLRTLSPVFCIDLGGRAGGATTQLQWKLPGSKRILYICWVWGQ